MFCCNCGKEIANNQKFCCFCGSENKLFLNSDSHVPLSKPNSKETTNLNDIISNRDVLQNYLYNLQTLEFAKNKLECDKARLEYRINSLCHPNSVSPKDVNYVAYIGGFVFMVCVFLLTLWINSGLNGDGFFSIFKDILQPIVTIVMCLSVIIAVVVVIVAICNYVQEGERYKADTKYEAQRMMAEAKEKQRLSSVLPHVKQDLEHTKELLTSGYSVNIIPEDIRGLYGIYFLYKYISTSQVSLNEAFFHFDLNEIKCKLDVIIEQQREIILKMARSNALNEQIVKQNEQTLRHAIATERNTELAAHYSQIAALNAETVAQIQNYYFFKNGF